jgi:hypothetical protein
VVFSFQWGLVVSFVLAELIVELIVGRTLGETKTQVLRFASAAMDEEVRRTHEFRMDNTPGWGFSV